MKVRGLTVLPQLAALQSGFPARRVPQGRPRVEGEPPARMPIYLFLTSMFLDEFAPNTKLVPILLTPIISRCILQVITVVPSNSGYLNGEWSGQQEVLGLEWSTPGIKANAEVMLRNTESYVPFPWLQRR